MTKLNGISYRNVRQEFVQKVRENPNISDHYKDKILNASEAKRQLYEFNLAHLQGGDADRKYYELKYPGITRCSECQRLTEQIAHNIENQRIQSIPNGQCIPVETVESVDIRNNECGSKKDCSFVTSVGSVDNSMSKKSSSTTMQTKISARELRQRVKSQCELHLAVDETLKHMDVPMLEEKWLRQRDSIAKNINIDIDQGRIENPQEIEQSFLPHIPTKSALLLAKNDKQLQTDNFRDPMSYEGFCCSDVSPAPLDDVVNSKIISPMIRKMQRIYINNMKEEMSILEDLERMPSQVNSLYKASFYDISYNKTTYDVKKQYKNK